MLYYGNTHRTGFVISLLHASVHKNICLDVFLCACVCVGLHVHNCLCVFLRERVHVHVFVGHSRLQARLHLAAIMLHASLTPFHSSTAGSCFKASLY